MSQFEIYDKYFFFLFISIKYNYFSQLFQEKFLQSPNYQPPFLVCKKYLIKNQSLLKQQSTIYTKILFYKLPDFSSRNIAHLYLIYLNWYIQSWAATRIVSYSRLLNPFNAIGLFLYPQKTSENQRFSDAFRGNRKKQWREMG